MCILACHFVPDLRMNQVIRNIVYILICFTVMPLGDLLFQCDPDVRRTFRLFEKTEIKILNAKNRRAFNQF